MEQNRMQQQKTRSIHEKILIVHGHNQVRVLVKQMLKANGYPNYIVVDNGRDALNIIKKEKIDLVICGWDVPIIHGIDLLILIKADPLRFNTPFFMVSGKNSLKNVFYALEEGVEGYLILPFSETDFTNMLRKSFESVSHPSIYQLKMNQLIRQKFNKKYMDAIKIGYSLLQERTNIRVTHLTGECLLEVQEYEKASSLIEKSINSQKSSKLLNLLGKIYMASGKTDEAVNYFELALKENPSNLDGHLSLAEFYFKSGDKIKGDEFLSSIMDSSPSFLDLVKVGQLYLDYSQEKAGIIFENILPIDETEKLFQKYADIIGKQNKNKESIEILKKCVEQLPHSFSSHYQLGIMYLKINKLDLAKECFKNTIRLKPGYGLAEEYLQKISN